MESITHVAITVRDLEAAESMYRELFAMRVFVREGQLPDGYKTFHEAIDWQRARALDLPITLVILENGPVMLALEQSEDGTQKLPDHVGLRVSSDELDTLRARVRAHGFTVRANTPDRFVFTDSIGMIWELQDSDVMVTSRSMGGGWVDADGVSHPS